MKMPSRLLCALLGVFTLLSFIPVSNAQDYTSGLVSHWLLNETTGTVANDSVSAMTGDWTSGDGNNIQTGPGIDGSAFAFDDANDEWLWINDNTHPLQGLTNLTVSMWVYPDSDDRKTWFSSRVNNNQTIVLLEHAANTTMGFRTYDTTGANSSVYIGKSNIPAGRWTHVTLTYDGTTRAYVNGVLAGTASTTGLGATRSHSSGSSDMRISNYSGGWPADGRMDNLRIYNRTLSDADVLSLYNSYYFDPDFESRMVGHWKLDRKSGTVAPDSSGNNNDGTLYNSPTWLSNSGHLPGALNIDGNTQYVQIPDNSSLDITTAVTAAAWVRHNPSGDNGGIICKQNSTNSSNANYCLYISNAGTYSFSLGDGSAQYVESTVTPDNDWHHFAAVADGQYVTLYLDGVEIYAEAQARTLTASSVDLYMGTWRAGFADSTTDADIDDARLYNRALTPVEIYGLYQYTGPTVGTLRFNDEADSLEYYDGDEWIHSGLGSYSPNAVYFDGGLDQVVLNSDLPDVSDGYKFSGSLWFRRTGGSGSTSIIYRNNSRFTVGFNTSNQFTFTGEMGGAIRVRGISTNTFTAANPGWHHVLFSFDVTDETDTSKRHIYIDGVDVSSWSVWDDSTPIDFANGAHSIGSYVDGSNEFEGDLADVWMDFNTYIDFSVEANRRKFISENGAPMVLGVNGSLPTGELPDIFLSGDTADWHVNKADGTAFTENGQITDSAYDPIKCEGVGPLTLLDVEDTPDDAGHIWSDGTYIYLVDKDTLRAHTFDGSTITPVGTPYDNPGLGQSVWGDGTYLYYNVNFAFGNHYIYVLTFNGTNFSVVDTYDVGHATSPLWGDGQYIYVPERTSGLMAYSFDGASLTLEGTWTDGTDISTVSGYDGYLFAGEDSSGEVYALTFDGSDFTLLDTYTHATATCCYPTVAPRDDGYLFVSYNSGNDVVAALRFNGTSFTEIDSINAGSSWNSGIFAGDHYIYVPGNSRISMLEFDGSSLSVFEESSGPQSTYPYAWHSGSNLWLGDDTYGLKVTTGYEGCSCTDPDGPQGRVLFNSTFNVMQYCNGTDWVAMSETGGTGSGCSDPTGEAGDMIYNTDYNILQYCDSEDWRGVGKNIYSMLNHGLVGHWPLDEDSGSAIADISGYGRNGTWSDGSGDDVAEETTTGIEARSLHYDGSDDEITVPSFNLEGDGLTIASWVNVDTLAYGPPYDQRIVTKASGTAINDSDWTFFFDTTSGSGRLTIRLKTTTATAWVIRSNFVPDTGVWYHLAVTYDEDTDLVSFYVDGVLYDSYTHGDGGAVSTSNSSIGIGNNPSGITARPLDGRLDDVRIWDRPLSAGEMRVLYDTYVSPNITAGLVGHWTMDDTSGGVLTDSSGNGNDAVWDDSDNDDVTEETTQGRLATAIQFDNSNDHGLVAADTALDNIFNNGGTYAAWIYPRSYGEGNYGRILAKNSSFDWQNMWHMDGARDEAFAFSVQCGGSYRWWRTTSGVLSLQQWSHIAVVFDSSDYTNSPTMYVNGVPVTYTTTGSCSGAIDDDSSENLFIGSASGLSRTFDGVIDDVRIYNRALSAADMALLYNTRDPSLDDGLVGHWKLDETTGTTAIDSSGNGNDGTMENGLDAGSDSTSGVMDTAINFPGTNVTRIAIPADATINNLSQFTACTWFYVDTFTNADSDSDLSLVHKNIWSVYIDNALTSPVLRFGVSTTSVYPRADGTTIISAGQWYHVCAVHYGIGTEPDLYVNGSEEGTSKVAGTGTQQDDSGRDLRIGAYNTNEYYGNFPGTIDDVRLYNRALESTEISSLYQLGAPDLTAGLQGHWQLDETSGTTAVDSSGNGYDGTMENGLDAGTDSVTGPVVTALDFDGSGDVIEMSEFSEAEGNTLSLSAWIRVNSVSDESNAGSIISKDRSGFLQWTLDRDSGTGGNGLSEICFEIATTSDAITCSMNEWPTDVGWHHVAAVYNGTDMRIYGDGQLINIPRAQTGSINSAFNHDICIGNAPTGTGCSSSGGWHGSLDDVRLYNRALKANEIQAMYAMAPTDIASGLIAHWTMDDTSGSTIVDRLSFSDGTWVDGSGDDVAEETVTGRIDTAVNFDGSDDMVQLPNLLTAEDPEPFTVCSWFNADSLHDGTIWNYARNDFTDFDRVITLGVKSSGVVFAGKEDQDAESSATYVPGTWAHVCGVFTANGDRTVYLNAGNSGTDTTSRGSDQLNRMAIGARWGDSSDRFFDGALDDIRIYTRALTVSEIDALYNSTSP